MGCTVPQARQHEQLLQAKVGMLAYVPRLVPCAHVPAIFARLPANQQLPAPPHPAAPPRTAM